MRGALQAADVDGECAALLTLSWAVAWSWQSRFTRLRARSVAWSLPARCPRDVQLDVTRQGQAEFRCVAEARHAAALQAQQSAAETALAAAKAELAAEAQAIRERCAAAVRHTEERALEWRGRYFEAVARVEAGELAIARLGKDLEKVDVANAAAAAFDDSSTPSSAVSTTSPSHSRPHVA
jgi:hypothetical protein